MNPPDDEPKPSDPLLAVTFVALPVTVNEYEPLALACSEGGETDAIPVKLEGAVIVTGPLNPAAKFRFTLTLVPMPLYTCTWFVLIDMVYGVTTFTLNVIDTVLLPPLSVTTTGPDTAPVDAEIPYVMTPDAVSEELPCANALTPLGVVMDELTVPVNDGAYVTLTPTVEFPPVNNVTEVDVEALAV